MSAVPRWGGAKQSASEREHRMTHKLRALGLALIAVFAMSAFVASAAQAGEFTSTEGFPVTVTGEQVEGKLEGSETVLKKHEFTTVAGVVKCNAAKFDSTEFTKNSKELTLDAEYKECTLAGIEVTVDMNGCDYLFTAGAFAGGTAPVETHVKCTGASLITITTSTKCQITIEQQTLNGITTHNTGGATTTMDVLATINVTGTKYIVHEGPTCPNKPA